MESISFSKTLGHPIAFHLPIHPPCSVSIFPKSHPLIKPSSRKTVLRVSHRSPSPSFNTLACLSSLLKPAVLTLTAAAAVFLARHSLRSVAAVVHPPPPAQSEKLPSLDEPSEQLLEENIASRPDDVDSLRALVEVKVREQKLPEAIAIVDRLILLDPSDHDLRLLKAHLHTYSGDTEKAKEGFEEILKVNPFIVEAYHGLVMAASHSHDTEELNEIVTRVVEVMKCCEKERKRRELMDLKLLLAQVRIVEGKYQDALKLYHDMVEEEPRDFRPYLCQGIVYTLMKKMDEADKNFKQYRKLVPKNHPYAQLFESNLSGINAAIMKNGDTENVDSLQS